MDTQDIAKFCLKALQLPKTENKTFFLGGPKGWVSSEIINLCEQLAGQSAKVNQIPLFIFKIITKFLHFIELLGHSCVALFFKLFNTRVH